MEPLIEVQNLSFRYAKKLEPVIRDLNFALRPGEIFGFLGPSGAGKSTTVKILVGLLSGYQGNVHVMGQDLSRGPTPALHSSLGVAFELPYLYERFTGLENLEWFAEFYPHPVPRLMGLLEELGLDRFAHQKVESYSKGMRMRLSLARSLVGNPQILFLDEPTSGLDPALAQDAVNLIRRKAQEGACVFLTTHNMNLAQNLCDRVAFLVDGQIKAEGNPHQLRKEHGKPTVKVQWLEAGGTAREGEWPLEGLGQQKGFQEIIASKPIASIHSQEADLDQIFLKVTGRSLV